MIWTGVVVALILIVIVLRLAGTPMRRAIMLERASCQAIEKKDWESAARFCRDSYRIVSAMKEPAKSRCEATVEVQLASILYRQGKMTEADDLFRKGFSKARATGRHTLMMQPLLVWGDLCIDDGRLSEAEQHYREALDLEEKTGNLGMMIFELQRLGDSPIRQDRRDEAEETINRAIALETRVVHEQMIREGKNPAEHHVLSWSMPDLHFCRGQYEDARQIYRRKVEFWEKSVTRPDNIDLGHLQMRLAAAEAHTGHRAEAQEMYTRAEATFAREWCEAHPKVAAARAAKADLTPAPLFR